MFQGKSSRIGLMMGGVLLLVMILSNWTPTQSIILTCTKLEYYGKDPYVMWQRQGEPRRYIGNGQKIFRGPDEKKYRMDTWLGKIATTQDEFATHYDIPFIPPLMAGKIWCMADRFRMRTPVTLEPTPKGKRSLGQKGVNSNFAYNCSEGKFQKIGPANRANQILQSKGVIRAHIGDPYNKPQVILGEDVYNVSCKKVQITYTGNEGKCYAGNAQAVFVSSKNYTSFRDRLGYLVQDPARVGCPQTNIHDKILGKIRRDIEENHASNAIAQAIIGTPFADLSVLFNQKAAYSMVVLSELCICSMNRMPGISDLYVLYRKYAALGTLILSMAYLLWTGSLFAAALCIRISPSNALRLVFPSFRRWKDLVSLRKDARRKEEERRRVEDRLTKNLPVCEFDDMAGKHFAEIYKNIRSLNKKISVLEKKGTQQQKNPTFPRTKNFRSTLRSYLSTSALPRESESKTDSVTSTQEKVPDAAEQQAETIEKEAADTKSPRHGSYNVQDATKARRKRTRFESKDHPHEHSDEEERAKEPKDDSAPISFRSPPTVKEIKEIFDSNSQTKQN